jgi:hypothetical protein
MARKSPKDRAEDREYADKAVEEESYKGGGRGAAAGLATTGASTIAGGLLGGPVGALAGLVAGARVSRKKYREASKEMDTARENIAKTYPKIKARKAENARLQKSKKK